VGAWATRRVLFCSAVWVGYVRARSGLGCKKRTTTGLCETAV